jgi:hypothetical protein
LTPVPALGSEMRLEVDPDDVYLQAVEFQAVPRPTITI